jgi:hypothetical protein
MYSVSISILSISVSVSVRVCISYSHSRPSYRQAAYIGGLVDGPGGHGAGTGLHLSRTAATHFGADVCDLGALRCWRERPNHNNHNEKTMTTTRNNNNDNNDDATTTTTTKTQHPLAPQAGCCCASSCSPSSCARSKPTACPGPMTSRATLTRSTSKSRR